MLRYKKEGLKQKNRKWKRYFEDAGVICALLVLYTRSIQWETGKVVLKITCMTNVIVCRVCEGSDLELPIDGVGPPAARIGT